MINVYRLVRKVQNDEVKVNFKDLGNNAEMLLFGDASFGNQTEGGSQGGFVIFIKGANEKVNPVMWQSKIIRRVVRSTMASEA